MVRARTVAYPPRARPRRIALEVNGPPAVSPLLAGQPLEIRPDGILVQQRSSGRPGSGARSTGDRASSSSPPVTRSRPSRGATRPGGRAAPGTLLAIVDGVQESDGERELSWRSARFERRARRARQGSTGSLRRARVPRDRRIVLSPPRAAGDHDRRDLQEEDLRVTLGPERRAAARVLDRQRERKPTVGRDGSEPVAELDRLGSRHGRDVAKDLERMEGGDRLALGCPEVGSRPWEKPPSALR